MINGHGDDSYQYPSIEANFSSNVYHQLDLSGLIQYLTENLQSISCYPEPEAGVLVNLLAKHHAIDKSCISVTNGATEAIYLIAQAFRGSQTTIVSPVFSEYADACQIHQHRIQAVFGLQDIPEQTQLCWLCSPNNPTGEVYSLQQLEALLNAYPQTVFVIDQSYAAFAFNATLAVDKVLDYKNLIILHSMTKQFAIPGLRLGYWVACPALVERINYFRMPWSVNRLAILAGQYLLNPSHNVTMDLPLLLKHTQQLREALSEFKALEVLPSGTHYFLVKLLNNKTAAELKQYLAYEHRLLIRDAANFVGLDEGYFRIATQTTEQNNKLVAAIKEWLA